MDRTGQLVARTLPGLAICLFLGVLGCQNQPTTYVYLVDPAAVEEAQQNATGSELQQTDPQALDLVIGGSPSKGAAVAKVTIVESSEFQ